MIISYNTRGKDRKKKKVTSKCNFCGVRWETETEQHPYICYKCESRHPSLQKAWKKKGLIK